jgi:broad specificity phosphatase PhoE
MQKIYFVRHGESQANLLKLFAGQTETPLTSEGKHQAYSAGRSIKKGAIKIDKIVSSTLTRARDSAEIIAEEIGYPIEEIISSFLFLERDYGILENSPRSEFFSSHSYEDLDNVPGVETIEQLHKRAKKAYKFLKSLEEDNILIVGHSGFFKSLVGVIEGNLLSKEYVSPFGSVINGQVYELL